MVHIITLIKKAIRAFASSFVIFTVLCASLNAEAESTVPAVSAKSAIIMSGGAVLYEKNADLRLPMASTTKLMTAIIALENCSLDDVVDIKSEYCNIEGSSMYLTPGEKCTVRELMAGLLLVSGNDAATALAGHIAGDNAHFAALMNEKARDLGMENTHYSNPHGLHDESHYTTARDLARLMIYCMQNPFFAELDAAKQYAIGDKLLLNHNRLLDICPGCIGGKTGYTESAGRCLVSCCERKGARTVCVTLNAPNDWNDHCSLYDWAYSACVKRCVTDSLSFSIPVISGDTRWVYLVPEKELTVLLPCDAEISLRAELPWFEFAPVHAGERGGRVTVSVDGETIAEYYLVYKNEASIRSR